MYDMKNLTKFKALGELAPDAFKAFIAFDEAALKDGAIPAKYKELMAVAVALTTQAPIASRSTPKKPRRPAQPKLSWLRQRWSPLPCAPAAPSPMARTRWLDECLSNCFGSDFPSQCWS
jgi:hypothetical protein